MHDPKPQLERLMEALTGKPRMRLVRLYTCSCCGKESEWGESWTVKYESQSAHSLDDPAPIAYACSDECREKLGK